jgi:hypothetical protein
MTGSQIRLSNIISEGKQIMDDLEADGNCNFVTRYK